MKTLREVWISGTLYTLGLVLAGADFEGIPWANMTGILMLILVVVLTNLPAKDMKPQTIRRA